MKEYVIGGKHMFLSNEAWKNLSEESSKKVKPESELNILNVAAARHIRLAAILKPSEK